MTTLTDLASRYRWELMLLIGIPVIEQTIWWLLPHILGNFNITFDVWSLPPFLRPFLNTSLLLLGFFYFHVRRLGRITLSLLWAFAFVYEAVETATYLLLNVNYLEQWSAIEISGSGWTWHISLEFLPPTIVLVWFARQASRISFSHALVLIGLATPGYVSRMIMSNLVFARFEDRAAAWDLGAFALVVMLFAVWVLSRLDVPKEKHETDIERWIGSWDIPVFGAALRRLAVRVLPLFDPARGISKELLVALFGLNWLLHAYLSLRSWVVYDFELATFTVTTVVAIVYTPLWTVLVILLAYAVRVRQPPERPSTIEPTATG